MRRSAARLQLVTGVAERPSPTAKALSLDDSELVAAVRQGDESAATSFHDRLRPRIEATVHRLLGRGDIEHDDLVQTSLIALVESIERYRGECSLDTWAASVTANVVYKHIRRRTIERRIFSAVELSDQVATPASAGRGLVARDYERRIREHLAAMDEAKSWTFLLHDVCGFDLREVSRITGVSVAAAQQRLVRGRREIHERIADDPELAACIGDLAEEP